AFIPEEYWTINASLECKNGKFIANYPTRIKSEKEATDLKKYLLESKFNVLSVKSSEQKKKPLPPLNTADLQKAGVVRYIFAAVRVMKTAHSFYELGNVTYISSDSYRCSDESILELRNWLTSNKFDIPNTFNEYKNKDASQD